MNSSIRTRTLQQNVGRDVNPDDERIEGPGLLFRRYLRCSLVAQRPPTAGDVQNPVQG